MSSKSPYPTRHYAVGQFLLTLRSRAKLTQAALAAHLGIHRRSVQKWESGETYPTVDNLYALLGLYMGLGVFTPAQERDEAAALWHLVSQHTPQQFPPFDTAWFDQWLIAEPAAELRDQQPRPDVSFQSDSASLPLLPPPTPAAQPQLFGFPFQTTLLIGREVELNALAKLLAEPACRLLTLVGPGGIGKTRLGLAAALANVQRFGDGVAFVPLIAVTSPHQIVATIGDALQLSFVGQVNPAAHLLAYLRTRQMLLLLDDFEHLSEGADIIVTLLQAAPRLTILVTSRVRLNLQAEWLFVVEGLAYPPGDANEALSPLSPAQMADFSAVNLFMQRATQLQPDLPKAESTLRTIGRICRYVAGVPLAIELAAAGVRSLAVAEIERQISSNLDTLSTTLRDVPPRHRSLRAVFDHSWRLLRAEEQVLLSRLSVFHGSWDQAAVYAICAQIARQSVTGELHYRFSPLELAALVDKSLVRREHEIEQTSREPRYVLLTPIREYAWEQLLARGEVSLLQRAHAIHYLTLAETAAAQWLSPTADAAIACLDFDRDNLRAALQWVRDGGDITIGLRLGGALIKFWRRRGALSEGRTWLEDLLAMADNRADDGVNAAYLRVMQGAAWLASDQHDYTRATDLFVQIVVLRRALGEREDETNLLVNEALRARVEGRYAQATMLLEDVLARQRALDNRGSFGSFGLGMTLFLLGMVQREQGSFGRAAALFEECIALHRALDDREGIAVGLLGLSDIARDQGHLAQVQKYGGESLSMLRQLGVQWAMGFVLNNLALAAYWADDLMSAFTLISQSVAIFRAQKAEGSLAEVLQTLGQLVWARQDVAAAYAALTEAVRLAWDVGPRLMVASALEQLAHLAVQPDRDVRDAPLATQFLAVAATLRTQMGAPVPPVEQPRLERTVAAMRLALGNDAFAAVWSEAAVTPLDAIFAAIPGVESFVATLPTDAAPAGAAPATQHPTYVDWGLARDVPALYGRAEELAILTQWVRAEQCRVVSIVGIGGIGKTSLAITFAKQIAPYFSKVIFRSLGEAPTIVDLLEQLIRGLTADQTAIPAQTADQLALLVELLRQARCLLILDNLETLFQPGMAGAAFLAGYEGYGALLKAVGATAHQSCLILTSRERPYDLAALEGPRTPVRTLPLRGLSEAACLAILADQDLFATAEEVALLAQQYGGNPLALKLVTDPIRALFGGNLAAFVSEGNLFFDGVSHLLDRQIRRATPLERALLTWLAIMRTAVTLDQLMAALAGAAPQDLSRSAVLTALYSLWRRNLVELGQGHLTFGLQRVVLEFLTEELVEHTLAELNGGVLDYLWRYALIQATAPDHIRHSQERLIGTPLLARLLKANGNKERTVRCLLALLDDWRNNAAVASSSEQGYGPGNVVNLLRLLRSNLCGLSLARLALRQVYLQGVEAQASSLAQSVIYDSVFTEAFGIVYAVASTPSGSYWAASSVNGAVQIWRDAGRTSHLSISAHTKQVRTLAFSPDEQLLATGSWDCTIKLWGTQLGALVSTLIGHTDYVQAIAFSPDGHRLASGSDDQTVRIWDVATGACLRTIHAHTDNTYGVVWSTDGKWVASCGFDHHVRIWDVVSGMCLQTFSGHTRPVSKLTFSPDMQLLASAGFDRTVRIWDIASGECIKLFTGHESTIMSIVWSADRRTVATCSYDGTIRLWALDHDTAQRILTGHGASINALAFSVDGTLLLSGSDDQTIRVWDVASGACARVIAGYGLFCFGVVWSPDGRSLLSANSDTTLTVWNVADGAIRMILRGHTRTVYGVAWSPDGHWLASSGYDQTVRLWDARRGDCVRVIAAHTDAVYRVVWWSPDGRWLASAGRDQAVRVWDIDTGRARWASRGHTGPINEVVWSPDGQRLASCGEDRTVRLWQAEDGSLMQTLTGHESSVAGVAWSPDGRWLASCGGGGATGELVLWDVKRGERVYSFVGHDSVVSHVVWSRDNKRLFSGGMSGAVYWWDVESGANLYIRQGHQSWLRSLNVSPDGSLLVSSGEDGLIQLWDTERAELVRTLRIDRPYERMDITGLTGITSAQRAALLALGAFERSA